MRVFAAGQSPVLDSAPGFFISSISPLITMITALPTWTFQASDSSDPTAGGFTTDNPAVASTTTIKFHNSTKYGVGGANGSHVGEILTFDLILKIIGLNRRTVPLQIVKPTK
jgi:hypothetical protein